MEKIEIEVTKDFKDQFESAVSACDDDGHKMYITNIVEENGSYVYKIEAFKEESFYHLGYKVGQLKKLFRS